MQDIYYICAQPSTFYYAWQVDAMLLSFEKYGNVDLSKVHIVSSVSLAKPQPTDHFKLVEQKWRGKGVKFDYYKDNRVNSGYISSIRPHILKKHWQKYPWLQEKTFFYHDCDIALTKPIKLDDKLSPEDNKTCYLSDTMSYIGAKYIEGKEHNLLEDMCAIVDIPPHIVRNRELESGGAQYLIKPGITPEFWDKVYQDCENLFTKITKKINEYKKEEPDWHELQIWCADMWAVLWNLWKNGYKTPCHKDLDFGWGTFNMAMWDANAIFHNAGVVKEEEGKPFYKSKYMSTAPTDAPRPGDDWASQKYYDLVTEAYESTVKPRCLIIGNGTSVLDVERGEEIDKFDTVVRFNSYKTKGYEKHVGQKTDIWATCNLQHINKIDTYKEVIAHSWSVGEDNCKIYKQLNDKRGDTWKIPADLWRRLKQDYGVYHPSTGLLVIFLMLERYDEVWLHGFDWWNREEHHYSDRQPRGHLHKPNQELEIIKSLGDKVKFLG